MLASITERRVECKNCGDRDNLRVYASGEPVFPFVCKKCMHYEYLLLFKEIEIQMTLCDESGKEAEEFLTDLEKMLKDIGLYAGNARIIRVHEYTE